LPFAVGARCPIDEKIFGIFGGDATFGIEQAERVEQRVGDEGEGGGARDADAVVAGEPKNFANKVADWADFRELAEFDGEFGEGISGRSTAGELFAVSGADEAPGLHPPHEG